MKKSIAILLSILFASTISYADEQEHFYGEWRERYEEYMKDCGGSPAIHTFSPNRYKYSPTFLCHPYLLIPYTAGLSSQTSIIKT
ncbi:MAG: hypothetical protein LBC75_09605 [Fibromonadaceae bacterium]|jgi:hypothetical protein|nr:hypothetical protein [Fibromonadaceae bacterium]